MTSRFLLGSCIVLGFVAFTLKAALGYVVADRSGRSGVLVSLPVLTGQHVDYSRILRRDNRTALCSLTGSHGLSRA